MDSNLVEAYMGRSEIRYRKGDFDGVISDSAKAIELNPALAEAWNNRPRATGKRGPGLSPTGLRSLGATEC